MGSMNNATPERSEPPRLRRIDLRPDHEKRAIDVTIHVDAGERVSLGPWEAGGAYELAHRLSEELGDTNEADLYGVLPLVADSVEPAPFAIVCSRKLALSVAHALAVEAARMLAGAKTSGQSVWEDGDAAVRSAVATKEDLANGG